MSEYLSPEVIAIRAKRAAKQAAEQAASPAPFAASPAAVAAELSADVLALRDRLAVQGLSAGDIVALFTPLMAKFESLMGKRPVPATAVVKVEREPMVVEKKPVVEPAAKKAVKKAKAKKAAQVAKSKKASQAKESFPGVKY